MDEIMDSLSRRERGALRRWATGQMGKGPQVRFVNLPEQAKQAWAKVKVVVLRSEDDSKVAEAILAWEE